ncbi:MAG: FapA family protein [Spirochaetales bacterium]|jgi:uncharacterized protein (DUF342 family)|nr:FapA family protein [Spirochaetales bacterium]
MAKDARGKFASSVSQDGSFSVFYQKGWVFLTVWPSEGKGKPVYPEEVKSRMQLLGMPEVPRRLLRECIERASGSDEALVEWEGGKVLLAIITVEVDEDDMAARVTVEPPKKGAAPPILGDILEALNKSGVVYGIDQPLIEKILLHREYGKSHTVAYGKEPVHSEETNVLYHFNSDRGKPYLTTGFDRVEFREINFIENKKKGELLAELVIPAEPVPGMTVRGEPILARSSQEGFALTAGANTFWDAERTHIFAAVDGNVVCSPTGEISIEQSITVDGVNLETGNLHFEGSIVVTGEIGDGFTVEAKGDIEVGGSVGRATLRAGGNILLKSAVRGNGEALIECGGDFFAKYVESARVICKGNAFIEEVVLHSQLVVWKHCILRGRKAEFIGGSVLAGGSLWCKKLGNTLEIPTYAMVGTNPSLFAAFKEAQRNKEQKEKELAEAKSQLALMGKAARESRGGEKVEKAKAQLASEVSRITADIALLAEKVSLLQKDLQVDSESFLVAEDFIFPGVTVTFGRREFHTSSKGSSKAILQMRGNRILESGYNPATKPNLKF